MSTLKETKTLSSVRADCEDDKGETKGYWSMRAVERFGNMEEKMIEGLNDENESSRGQPSQRMQGHYL